MDGEGSLSRRARISILNGPNLNLLGVREPHIYGRTTLKQIEQDCRTLAKNLGVDLEFRQTNHEGVLVETIQAARRKSRALIINPAGFSFSSVAIIDALKTFEGPIIELHVSNIHARDETHRYSKISAAATAVICGLGPHGYVVALQAAVRMIGADDRGVPKSA